MNPRAVCSIPNCGRRAQAGEAFCSQHRNNPTPPVGAQSERSSAPQPPAPRTAREPTPTALDLGSISKSLASMVVEYVEGGIHSNQNWRNGLDVVIERRLQRLLPTPTASSGGVGREEIALVVFKCAFHPADVATAELIERRKQDFLPTWEHAQECADAILALFQRLAPGDAIARQRTLGDPLASFAGSASAVPQQSEGE